VGEIAEAMLEGFIDEETGEVIDGEAPGYPRSRSRSECVIDPFLERIAQVDRPRTVPCPGCRKMFHNEFALNQHRAAKDH
jgi:hypothetical protein